MSYPPPYWMSGGWYYAWPWLWMDGDPDPGYNYVRWEYYLQQRLPVPASFELDLAGAYDSATRTGWIDVTVRNQRTTAYTGTLQFVITESNLHYHAPNGLEWHHHVARDMVPTHTGTPVTVQPGETAVVNLPFRIQSTWVEDECELICFLHDNTFQPDSTREVQQATKVALFDLQDPAAVAESGSLHPAVMFHPCRPNPCRERTEISFTLRQAADVKLEIFDAAGRRVAMPLDETLSAGTHIVPWDGVADSGERTLSGVYFCKLNALDGSWTRPLLIAR